VRKILAFSKANLLLILILILGIILRFYRLNWDQGFPTHPDERDLVMAASRIRFFSNLDPKFFTYGGVSIYIISLVTNTLHFLTRDPSWFNNLYRIHLVSRLVSAGFSLVSLVFIYLTATKLFNRKVGLLSVILSVFTPIFIQYAHYGVADSALTAFALALLFFSVGFNKKPDFKNICLMAAALGLAVGTKYQGALFTIIPITSIMVTKYKKEAYRQMVKDVLILGIFSTVIFLIFNAFIFTDWQTFWEEFSLASGYASGKTVIHFTLQFIGTPKFLYLLKNLYWTVGFSAYIGVVGFIYMAVNVAKKKEMRLLPFVLFPIVYFVYIGTQYAKFVRYQLPLIPFLIISAGYLLFEITKKFRLVGLIFIFLIIVFSAFWGLAFFSVYQKPMTTVLASRWIFENTKPGSKILTEALDLKLPLALDARFDKYQITELPMYEKDTPQKEKLVESRLSESDYLIFSSPRFWKNIPKDPGNYPYSTTFYSDIFSGKYGYRKAAEFNQYPCFLGICIPDDGAEETFKVFDHPQVIIFKNIR
jgi:hypothetical protein